MITFSLLGYQEGPYTSGHSQPDCLKMQEKSFLRSIPCPSVIHGNLGINSLFSILFSLFGFTQNANGVVIV